jgi:hypothetical protein
MANIEVKKGIDGKDYKVYEGTWYNIGTCDGVIYALDKARKAERRVHVLFCYPEEKDVPQEWESKFSAKEIWLEEYDTVGRISRSCGDIKMPLLIKNSRSYGGGGLLTANIGRIIDVETKKVLYNLDGLFSPALNIEEAEGGFTLAYKTRKMKDFEAYAMAKDRRTLERLEQFLIGLRHTAGGR